jgi:hypothetical protein
MKSRTVTIHTMSTCTVTTRTLHIRTMKTLLILLAAGVALHAHAAAPNAAPTEKTIGAALTRYLAERGDLCVGKFNWPIDVSDADREAGSRDAVQLPVLVQLGMADESHPTPEITRYALTRAGQRAYVTRKMESLDGRGKPQEHDGDFCAAKLSLAKVVKWTPPLKNGDYQETTATFTYKVAPAAWIADPRAQQVFPMIARIVNGAGSMQLTQRLRLVGTRWEALTPAM